MRNIIKIDESKCNGCGLCVHACAEGAIKIINGKAKLISETYCDGLGACLGRCPQGAITIEQRQAAEFDEAAVKKHLESQKAQQPARPEGFVCPGLATKMFKQKSQAGNIDDADTGQSESELTHWPIQLHLVNPNAPFLKNADLLIAADCVGFAFSDFHKRLLKGRSVIIACPKLDDTSGYVGKLSEIIRNNDLKSITVAHMEVPCCFGLKRLVETAVAMSGINIGFNDITVSLDGHIQQP